MNTTTYTNIIEKREKAVHFELADGEQVWLPKNGLFVNPVAKTVTSNLLEKQMRQAADAGVTVDLGPDFKPTKSGKSVFYRVTLTFDHGDPDFSTHSVLVFVPVDLNAPGATPMWLVRQAIEREVPADMLKLAYTVRTEAGEVVMAENQEHQPDDPAEAALAEAEAAAEDGPAHAAAAAADPDFEGPDASEVDEAWDGSAA